jgi:hypothetical protein
MNWIAYYVQFLFNIAVLRWQLLTRIKRNPVLYAQLNQFHLQTTSPCMAPPPNDNHYPIFEPKRNNSIDWA